jgi:DNA-binding NtrC family response regulator
VQGKCYEPLRGTKSVKADVRILVATNKKLATQVRLGDFREDLYYRIYVIQLTLPSLKDRNEDIPLLAEHFITRFNRLQGKDVVGVAPVTMALLMAYDYPGNVREL